MKLFLELCLVFACVQLYGATRFRSDYTFLEEVDGWIKLHRVPTTWPEARLRCDLEGAALVSPTNVEMLQAMMTLMSDNQLSPPSTVFTGIHDTYSKGDYYSIEGVPLEKIPANWAPNEPDNFKNGQDCLILYSNGTMADVRCDTIHSYVCYRKKTEDMPEMSECGTIDPEYHYEPRTGSCYKYHRFARTWSRAFKVCAAEGGHLAIVNSPIEAQVFKELYTKYPNHTGNKHKSIVFLGFRYTFEQEQWLTIHGETLEKAGYTCWSKGEPNNVKAKEQNWEGEYCGSIDMGYPDIGLNDMWCGFKNPFICERQRSLVPKVYEWPDTTRLPLFTIRGTATKRQEETTTT